MLFTSRRKKIEENERQLSQYHDDSLAMYKKFIDKLNTTQHPAIKNICIQQCRIIKKSWTETFKFDVEELTKLDPIGIKI